MEDFRINLNSTTNIFFSNEEVTGKVYLRTSEPIKSRKIELKMIGRTKTGFMIIINQISYPYKAVTNYLQIEQNLWESSDDDSNNKIPPGIHEYPFSFVIPKDAPANLINQYGTIRYYVKATIVIPWGINKNVYDGFTVCPYIDLNLDSKLAMPVISAIHKTSLFSSKAVNLVINMPKMGYVCGESIPLRIEINNESSNEITSVESGIRASYTFIAYHELLRFKDTQKRESNHNYGVTKVPFPVSSGQKTVFQRQIEIPPLPPSLSHCPNIILRYHVFVKVHTSAVFSRSACASMPIVIGTVPLKQIITNTAPGVIGFEALVQVPSPTYPPPDYDFGQASFGESCEANYSEEDGSGKKQDKYKLIKKSDDDDDEGPDYLPKFAYFPNLSQK